MFLWRSNNNGFPVVLRAESLLRRKINERPTHRKGALVLHFPCVCHIYSRPVARYFNSSKWMMIGRGARYNGQHYRVKRI